MAKDKTKEVEYEEPIKKEQLYKYNIGDEVFTMEDNKVKSFVIKKRIILTYQYNDSEEQTEVYYDVLPWDSLKAQYNEKNLYPTKKDLLESL